MHLPTNILIIGATSAIAEATARKWARNGASFYLTGRDEERLGLVAQDLKTRGSRVWTKRFDVNSMETHATVVDDALSIMGGIDTALIAHGSLPNQAECERNMDVMLTAVVTNATSAVALLARVATHMSDARTGVIAVISSVAGDRGRKSNFVYGSCKAMVTVFAEGLAGRLARDGVTVITIKPGLVDTPMTADFKKGLLWASPDVVASIINRRVRAQQSGTYYAPRFWRTIMLVIRFLPVRVLYRLNI